VGRLLLVRHAPTAHNVARIFQGQTDVPALEVEHPEQYALPPGSRTVYTSPLRRALAGVRLLFPGEPVITDARLQERSVGTWEGLDHATVQAGWPATFRPDGTLDPWAEPPGGETLESFAARVESFLDDVPDLGHDVYAVTHNGWIRVALWLAGQVDRESLFAESTPFLRPVELRR
jgi:2,3-bisphosphoglycerate-dependent phosphoglycerate mutase